MHPKVQNKTDRPGRWFASDKGVRLLVDGARWPGWDLRRDACDAIRREARKVDRGYSAWRQAAFSSAAETCSLLCLVSLSQPTTKRKAAQNVINYIADPEEFGGFGAGLQVHWQPRLKHTVQGVDRKTDLISALASEFE